MHLDFAEWAIRARNYCNQTGDIRAEWRDVTNDEHIWEIWQKLHADNGFNTYSTLIETRREIVDKKPDLVQRFVDASAIGWYNYLYGDNKAANELIRKHNPEMSQELIDYSIAKMKEFGIVDSGDAEKLGIGAMTDEHIDTTAITAGRGSIGRSLAPVGQLAFVIVRARQAITTLGSAPSR